MSTQIEIVEETKAIELYKSNAIRPLIEKLKQDVLSIVTDPTTEKGRKEIASLAHKVARTKTALDSAGKSLTDEQRKQMDAVNAERRWIRDELDILKEDVRRPLTEYEQREAERVNAHKAKVEQIKALADGIQGMGSADIMTRIVSLKAIDLASLEEFCTAAKTEHEQVKMILETAHAAAENAEKERAELERLRKEKEERERKERDEAIAREAAEKAKALAEAVAEKKAKIERERIANLEREKQEAAARHQRELEEAKAKAAAEVERIERERQAKLDRAKAEAERRAADQAHREKVIHDAVSGVVGLGVDQPTAKQIVEGIAEGKVPNVKLNF